MLHTCKVWSLCNVPNQIVWSCWGFLYLKWVGTSIKKTTNSLFWHNDLIHCWSFQTQYVFVKTCRMACSKTLHTEKLLREEPKFCLCSCVWCCRLARWKPNQTNKKPKTNAINANSNQCRILDLGMHRELGPPECSHNCTGPGKGGIYVRKEMRKYRWFK